MNNMLKVNNGKAASIFVNFRMYGGQYRVPTKKRLKEEEFYQYLLFARRMIGYVVAPKFALSRIFMSEVVEMLKKRGIYRHKVKKAAKELINALDKIERLHTKSIDAEFMEIMTNSLAGKGLAKTNELRGAIGGAMLHEGVKEYIFYSYPYTVMELCHEAMCAYNSCMDCVWDRCGVQLTEPFLEFRGDSVYNLSIVLMRNVVDAIGEKIPRLDFKRSGAVAKVDSLGNLLLDMDNLHDAFQEAAEELGGEDMLNLWDDEEDIADKLNEKYKVTKL